MTQAMHRVAKVAGFWVLPVAESGKVRVRGNVIEIGPDASKDRVITAACQRVLDADDVPRGEQATRVFVEALGASYVPERKTCGNRP